MMSDSGKFFLLLMAGTGLLCAILAYPLTTYFPEKVYIAVAVGACTGLLNIIIAYQFNKRAFVAASTRFLRLFFAGMVIRFTIIALVFIVIIKLTDLDIKAFIFSMLIFYLALQFYEVRFINSQLARKKKKI